MNENQFDEFFRNKLLKYSSPVPGDIWKKIQQKKDKDRKGFFFKWSLAVLLLIFLTAGYFILHTGKNTDSQKAIYPANKSNIETQKSSGELSKKTEKNEPGKTNTGTTLINPENNKISSAKQFDNNEKYLF